MEVPAALVAAAERNDADAVERIQRAATASQSASSSPRAARWMRSKASASFRSAAATSSMVKSRTDALWRKLVHATRQAFTTAFKIGAVVQLYE